MFLGTKDDMIYKTKENASSHGAYIGGARIMKKINKKNL